MYRLFRGNPAGGHQILDLDHRIARARETGVPFEPVLNPPPADPQVTREAKPQTPGGYLQANKDERQIGQERRLSQAKRIL
jgi:hypothetical protein